MSISWPTHMNVTASPSAKAALLSALIDRVMIERQSRILFLTLAQRRSEPAAAAARVLFRKISDDERRHGHAAREALAALGGDLDSLPTCDVARPIRRLAAALAEPEVTIAECVEGVLLAKLGYDEGWRSLLAALEANGYCALADHLGCVWREERAHLQALRSWLAATADGGGVAPALTSATVRVGRPRHATLQDMGGRS